MTEDQRRTRRTGQPSAGFWRRTALSGFALLTLTSFSVMEPGDEWDIVRTMSSGLTWATLIWLPDERRSDAPPTGEGP